MTDIRLTDSRHLGAHAPRGPSRRRSTACGAYLRNDAVERDRARRDPDGFWAEQAAGVDWMEPWEQVSDCIRTACEPGFTVRSGRSIPHGPLEVNCKSATNGDPGRLLAWTSTDGR